MKYLASLLLILPTLCFGQWLQEQTANPPTGLAQGAFFAPDSAYIVAGPRIFNYTPGSIGFQFHNGTISGAFRGIVRTGPDRFVACHTSSGTADSARIMLSTDRGNSWWATYTPTFRAENFSKMLGFGNGVVITAGWGGKKFYRSTDYGVTWTTTPQKYNPAATTSAAGNPFANKSGVVITPFRQSGNRQVNRSNNYGLTWDSVSYTTTTGYISGVFITEQKVIMVGNGVYATSTDAGLTWTQTTVSGRNFNGAIARDSLVVYRYGSLNSAGLVEVTTDGGLTWNAQLMASAPTVNDLQLFNDTLMYALCANGVLMKTTNAGGGVPVSVKSKQPSTAVSVFPNPVSREVNLQVIGPAPPSAYKLVNLNGQEMQGGALHFLENLATIDVTQVPRGVYLLQLSNEAGVPATYRIVVQ